MRAAETAITEGFQRRRHLLFAEQGGGILQQERPFIARDDTPELLVVLAVEITQSEVQLPSGQGGRRAHDLLAARDVDDR